MATTNKTDRKKLVKTQIVGGTVVFQRADTGAEFARVDTTDLSADMVRATLVYGVKQIVSDVAADATGIDERVTAMGDAVKQLTGGTWPRRQSEANVDKAAETLALSMGITVDKLKEMLNTAK